MAWTSTLPAHLLNLIKNSKYVHVATCSKDCIPSVALMNYIYVPGEKLFGQTDNKNDYIVFVTPQDTQKFYNIKENPKVWPLGKESISGTPTPTSIPHDEQRQSKLLNLLQELNQAELNQMSASIGGETEIVNPESEESKYYKDLILKANPDAKAFIFEKNTTVVKVRIDNARVSNNENRTMFLSKGKS
ncbi:CFF_collapsed_G0058750.mRNA.1.CDS.1 [Saccharomyces cerevisiae]|nr:CFF_collapsed_G0058750.mRNA.1.CDS.1 [Saccharomyces cerevisiae]